jgi:two-component system osmolarity sensor histidine kinase EnvZ
MTQTPPEPTYMLPPPVAAVPRSWWRRVLPNSIFGRTLLIMLLPTLLVQAAASYLFYVRHWDNISRHFAASAAGEIAMLTEDFYRDDDKRRAALIALAQRHMNMFMKWREVGKHHEQERMVAEFDDPLFDDLARNLDQRLDYPFQLERMPGDTHVRVVVLLPDGELSFMMSKKRLSSPTISLWFIGNAVVLFLVVLIAVLFLRNQVRPIVQLARAADRFGRGQDIAHFHPHGAREVRMASHAFLLMKERLTRMLASRTEMLAAISHDLRTPLTRMRLQLAMMPQGEQTERLAGEIARMDGMIEEYLEFVRGNGEEKAVRMNLRTLLSELTEEYQQAGQSVELVAPQGVEVSLRARAFRRAVANLVDNALRYGAQCRITLDVSLSLVSLHIEDNGPGIPANSREEVFLPFRRLDSTRNQATGGAGLGLSIVREIIHAHGGKVQLADSELGGLQASIILPR